MEMISVIVPAFNAEGTICRCLQTILDGTYKAIEVVVVNDGSTDETERIIKEIAQRDKRVKLISQNNMGVAGARNTGLQHATGRYVAWCDADDWVESDWLETLYTQLVGNHADIAVCRCKIDGRQSVNTGEVEIWNRDMVFCKFLEHKELNGSLCNKLFCREIIGNNQFDNKLGYFEDDQFLWDCIKNVSCIVRVHSEKYHITTSPHSLTGGGVIQSEFNRFVFGKILLINAGQCTQSTRT